MIRYLKLWIKSFKLDLAKDMMYTSNFIMHVIGKIIFGVISPLTMTLIYSTTKGFSGWSYWEIMCMIGTATMIWGLTDFIIGPITSKIMSDVEHGTFDRTLVRPYRPLMFTTLTSVDIDGLPEAIVGMIILVVSAMKITVTSMALLKFLVVVFLAMVAIYAFVVMIAWLTFLVVKSWGIWALWDLFEQYTEYPLTIYGPTLAAALTFIVPAGLAAFYPASALLGRLDWSFIGYLAIYAFAFLGINVGMWHVAMKKYSSAGG